MLKTTTAFFVLALSGSLVAGVPPTEDLRLFDIAEASSAERIKADIETLVSFGTRHSLSETESETHGVGAARRWIRDQFEAIS